MMNIYFLKEFIQEIDKQILKSNLGNDEIVKHCEILTGYYEKLVLSPINKNVLGNWTKACRHLEECYNTNINEDDRVLIQLIESVEEYITWTEGYMDEISDNEFLNNFSYGEIIGRNGFYFNSKVTIGLTIIGPNLFYPWHHHPAVEFYYILNSNSKWGKDGGILEEKSAGDAIFHPSMISHAIETGKNSLLALWFWTGDTETKSKFIRNR